MWWFLQLCLVSLAFARSDLPISSKPPDTDCIPDDPCRIFTRPPKAFARCLVRLNNRVRRRMLDDCKAVMHSDEQVTLLFRNLERLCKAKTGRRIKLTFSCKDACIPDYPCRIIRNPTGRLARCLAQLRDRNGNLQQRRLLKECETVMDSAEKITALFNNIEQKCKAKTGITVQLTFSCKEVCKYIVFMVEGSIGVGLHDFEELGDFVKLVMTELAEVTTISDNCTNIGLLSFSATVNITIELDAIHDLAELLSEVDNMGSEFSVTNTHEAINSLNTMLFAVDNADLDKVGVLLSVNRATNWRATVQSMVDLYDNQPDVKMVVVAVEHPRRNEVYDIATGTVDDNVVEVDMSDLDADAAEEVVTKIMAPNGVQGCTQWAVLDTMTNILGEAMIGVYEQKPGVSCHGENIYRNNKHVLDPSAEWEPDLYLAAQFFGGFILENRWNINLLPPVASGCNQGLPVAFLDFSCFGCTPDDEPWNEYNIIINDFEEFSPMQIECYN